MKWVWRGLAGLGILVVVLVAGVVVFLSTIDPNDYRGIVTGPVKQATGRELTVTGVRELKVGIPIALAVDGARFENAPWGSRPEMATVERLEAEVAILPLILGELRVERVVLSGVDLLLETDAEGRGNWVFEAAREPEAPAPDDAAPSGPRAIPFVRAMALRDVTVTYRDGRTGRSDSAEIASLDLSAESPTSAMDLTLEAKVNEAPVTVAGTVGSLKGLFQGSQPFPVSLEAKGLGATLAAEGAIARPLEASGLDLNVNLAGEGLAEEAARAGLALPDLPAYSLTGRLTDPEGDYALDGLKASLGKTSVTGQARLSLAGERPRVEAALGAQVLDLGVLAPAAPEAEAKTADGEADGGKRVIPDAALPLADLGALDAKLTLKVDRLVLTPELAAEEVAVSADLEGGRLALQPEFGRFAQGRLKSHVVAERSGAVSARVEARGLALGELLTALGVTDSVDDGPFDADLDLSGKGASLRPIMASLNGEVRVVVGEGRVHSRALDLAGANALGQVIRAVDPRAKEGGGAELKCAVFRASVASGTATFDKGIGIESDKADILGAGTIDLETEALDLGIRSEPKESVGVSVTGTASRLVRVRGTIAEPTVGVDPVGAATSAARVGGALMTGGLSLLGEAAFGKIKGGKPPCQIALGKAAGGAESGEAEAEREEEGGGIIESIGDGIKSLFGD